MDDYLKQYREMIFFRGLTDHILTAYSTTYISAYLGRPSSGTGTPCRFPKDPLLRLPE